MNNTPVNLVFNLFSSGDNSLWRCYSPCFLCGSDTSIKCPFGSKCAFPKNDKDEVFCQMKHKLKNRIDNDPHRDDMLLTFKFFLAKHQITLKTALCNRRHDVSRNEECGRRGFAHSADELLDGFRHPLTRRYFFTNVINQVDDGYMLPAEKLHCQHCPGRSVNITIYTHLPNGALRMPVCNLVCNQCSNQSYYSLYENLL
jgi:hypothetical protein